jgi:hypothetical protein
MSNKSEIKSCPKGKILRSSYTRKSYTRKDGTKIKSSKVSAKCIRDLGKSGKGKKLFTLKKGGLTKYGYTLKTNEKNRIVSLKKAGKSYDKGTLIKKLNALYVLHKNTNPLYAKRARTDMKWVQKNM